MAKQEELVEEFDDGQGEFVEEDEIVVEEETEVIEPEKKVIKQLAEDKVKDNKDGNSLYPKYQEYIEVLGGWDNLSDADKKRMNGTFKKPSGKTIGTEVARSAAHQRAIDLKKSIVGSMYAVLEKDLTEFKELQSLNPNAKLTVETYLKGWGKFTKGLPED